jgi:hypothetical protein
VKVLQPCLAFTPSDRPPSFSILAQKIQAIITTNNQEKARGSGDGEAAASGGGGGEGDDFMTGFGDSFAIGVDDAPPPPPPKTTKATVTNFAGAASSTDDLGGFDGFVR